MKKGIIKIVKPLDTMILGSRQMRDQVERGYIIALRKY
jgi:hypothetical protein